MAKFRKVNLPAIQYRVAEGRLFLHMKSCFELLDLVAAVMSSKKGYGAINTSTSGLEVSSCYLAARGQHYHYISCLALLTLLESKDSLIICLTRKDKLRQGMLGVAHPGGGGQKPARPGDWLSPAPVQGKGRGALPAPGPGLQHVWPAGGRQGLGGAQPGAGGQGPGQGAVLPGGGGGQVRLSLEMGRWGWP